MFVYKKVMFFTLFAFGISGISAFAGKKTEDCSCTVKSSVGGVSTEEVYQAGNVSARGTKNGKERKLANRCRIECKKKAGPFISKHNVLVKQKAIELCQSGNVTSDSNQTLDADFKIIANPGGDIVKAGRKRHRLGAIFGSLVPVSGALPSIVRASKNKSVARGIASANRDKKVDAKICAKLGSSVSVPAAGPALEGIPLEE